MQGGSPGNIVPVLVQDGNDGGADVTAALGRAAAAALTAVWYSVPRNVPTWGKSPGTTPMAIQVSKLR